MADSKLDVVLRLQGARKFQTDANKSAGAINRIGRSGKGANQQLGRSNKVTERAAGGFKRAAGAAAGLAAGYVGIAAAKEAISTTAGLAKTTIGLTKNLGLSTEQASAWAATAKIRGVESKALNMSFGTLAKQATAAGEGTEASANAFKKLGISQAEVKKLDFNTLIGRASDGLKKMGPGAERTALSMKLFGRGWQTIVPLLRGGSKEMNAQLALAKKYGATFGGKTIKSMSDFIQAQRESEFAMLGLKVTFATAVVPWLTKGMGAINRFAAGMRSGKGAGGQFAAVMKSVWGAVGPLVVGFIRGASAVSRFTSKHRTLMKVLTTLSALSLMVRGMRALTFVVSHAGAVFGGFGRRVSSVFRTVVGVVRGAPKAISGAAKGMFDGIKDAFRSAINFIIRGWNSLDFKIPGFDPPGPGPKFGGATIGVPNIKELAAGGRLRPGESSWVGEMGPEILTARPGGGFVTPLKTMATPDLRKRGGGPTEIVLHNNVHLDGRKVGQSVSRATADAKARR